MKLLFTVTIVLTALMSSCQPPKSVISRVKWGVLGQDGSKSLIDVKPGESIGVCGNDPAAVQALISAIKAWAEPIGRASQLKIINSCNGSSKFVRITAGSKGPCPEGAAGCSGGNDIWVMDYRSAVGIHIVLHEVGHQWGLCDQYDVTAAFGLPDNCEFEGPRGKDPNAVMGSARGLTRLTADDIEGIKYLADLHPTMRRRSSANDQWKKIQSNNPGPSGDENGQQLPDNQIPDEQLSDNQIPEDQFSDNQVPNDNPEDWFSGFRDNQDGGVTPPPSNSGGSCSKTRQNGQYFCGVYGPFSNSSLDGFTCGDNGVNDLCLK